MFSAQAKSSKEIERLSKVFAPLLNEKSQHFNPDFAKIMSFSGILSDELLDEADEYGDDEKWEPALFQGTAVDEVIDALVASRAPMIFVKGDPGSGKTAVIHDVVLKLVSGEVPLPTVYQKRTSGVGTIKISMRNFMVGGPLDIKYYFDVLHTVSKNLNKKIAVVFTDAEFVTPYIVSVLKEEADRGPGKSIPSILETDNKSYGNAIKGHPSLTSVVPTVTVTALKSPQVIAILKKRAEQLKDYNVQLSDKIFEALVDVAPDYRRDVSEPRRSLQLLEKFMISQRRRIGNDKKVEPSKIDLYKFVAEQVKLPVIPQNEQEFAEYMDNVKKDIKQELVGQDANVDGIVDQFVAALTSRTRSHTSAILLGSTGVGKSLIAKKLAEKFYGDKNRLLELDMTQFSSERALDTLFGAANGIVSADKEKGVLCDFFTGPGQGGGIVLMNEIEEMPAQALTRFMEMLDTGYFRGGDGTVHYVGRSFFMLTSNKNSSRLLSPDAIRGVTQAELDRRVAGITQEQMKKAFTEKVSYTEDSRKQAKPAVFERIDRFYYFAPLLKENAIKVAQLEIDSWLKEYNKENTTQIAADSSVAEVATSAFYNEALGARQVRTSVNLFLTRAVQAFKKEFGYDVKNLTVSATLHPSLKTVSYITVTNPENGQKKTIDGPRVPVDNRLFDKEFRDALTNLEKNLNSEIFGQQESISKVVSALKARFLRGGKGEVTAGFLCGVTGSGKSEIGKLISKYLYGNEEAIGIFEMGRIQHKTDLNTILSPGKGIIGSDEPGELEQFLMKYPEGGVLMFDELSNAGGDDPGLKSAIVKQFYNMMQEGYYKSPSGNVYNLRNHLILFTGNDGEEVLKGRTSDSMLLEAYNEFVKDPNNLKAFLYRKGFTDAFMGRLAFMSFMRPTLTPVKKLIAGKMLNRWKKEVEANQPFDIEFGQDLVDEIGLLQFSPTTGARSISEFISNTLGQLVADEALKADWEHLLGTGQRGKIALSVSTIKPSRPFYTGDVPEKTQAVLKAVMTVDGVARDEVTIDFTKSANFQPTVHIDVADATAVHEMGHLVTSYTKITGRKPVKITITPEKVGDGLQALGYVQYRGVPRNGHANLEFLVANAAGLYAGSEAEFMSIHDWNGGRSSDVESAGGLIRKMVLDSHMDPRFDAIHAFLDKNGEYINNIPESLKAEFDRYVNEIMRAAKQTAQDTIRANWHVVSAGKKLLLEVGSLNEKQIEELMKQGEVYRVRMDQLMASGWTKEAAEEIGDQIDLDKVKAAGKEECEQLLIAGTGGGQ